MSLVQIRHIVLAMWCLAITGSGATITVPNTQTYTLVRTRGAHQYASNLSSVITSATTWRGEDAASMRQDEENNNCFVHEMATSSDFFQAGDVWEVCVGPIPHQDTSMRGAAVEGASLDDREDQSDAPFGAGLKEVSFSSFPALTSTGLSTTALRVHPGVVDALNVSACAPGDPQQRCNLRSAVEFCKDVLTSVNQECLIEMQPQEGESLCVELDPEMKELSLRDLKGQLRIDGGGCTLSPVAGTTPGNASRLISIRDRGLRTNEFVFHLENATIAGFGRPQAVGGAMYFNGLSLVIDSVLFKDNVGNVGGALMVDQCSGVQFNSTRFVNNTAASDGGGLYMNRFNYDVNFTHCEFSGNSVTGQGRSELGTSHFTGGGLGVNSFNELFLLSDCTFVNNSGRTGGGASFFQFNKDIELYDCHFLDNTASGSVGALYFVYSNEDIALHRCEFIRNVAATNSGALRLFDGNLEVQILECLFRENEAFFDHAGGVGIVYNNYMIRIANCVFERNAIVSGGWGAGVMFGNQNSFLSISNCTFRENWSSSGAGGAMVFFFENFRIRIADCTFLGNSVLIGDGGGVYVDKDNEEVLVVNCYFWGNTAPVGTGGALHIHSHNLYLLIDRTAFVNNSAGEDGGAMSFVTDNLYNNISSCYFSNNTATEAGGALYSALANSGMRIVDCSFTYNVAGDEGGALYFGQDHDTIELVNTTVDHNRAQNAGGFFFFFSNDVVTVEGCRVESNFGLQSVGGIMSFADEFRMTRSTIVSNRASGDYGGVFLQFAEKVLVGGCTFADNTAEGILSDIFVDVDFYGSGALAISECNNVDIVSCNITNNYAYHFGGGIFVSYSTSVDISNTSVAHNIAFSGSAVNMYRCRDVAMSGLVVEDNLAERNGGGLYFDQVEGFLVTASSFRRNVAETRSGSAIWLLKSEGNITWNTFDQNSAPLGAGTVYWIKFDFDGGEASEPHGLRGPTNNFTNTNNASYGLRWATEATMLMAGKNGLLDVVDYEQGLPSFSLELHDFYHQRVVTEDSSFAQLRVADDSMPHDCQGNSGYIGGGIVQQFERGVAQFDDVDVFCAPGGVQYLEGDSELATRPALIEVSFRSCVIGEYFAESICSPCPDGTYSFTDPAKTNLSEMTRTVCQPCPDGAESCSMNTIVVSPGHWRINDEAETILRCPWGENSCPGSNETGDKSCRESYLGPLCAVCEDNYFYVQSTDTCMSCGDPAAWFDAFTVSVLVLLLGTIVFSVFYLQKVMREQKLESVDEVFISLLLKLRVVDCEVYDAVPFAMNEIILIFNRQMRTLFKTYLTFLQVASSIPSVLSFDKLPDEYQQLFGQVSAVVNFGVSRVAMHQCFFSSSFDFIDKLLVDTIYPAVVLLLFVVVFQVHIFVKFRRVADRNSSSSVASAATNNAKINDIRSKYVEYFLFFTYLILPSVAETIFEIFRCQNIDPDGVEGGDNWYLRADYSVSCQSTRYHYAMGWASLMIVVYVLGIPAFYGYLLYTSRDEIRLRDKELDIVLRDVSVVAADRDEVEVPSSQQRFLAIRYLFDSYKPCFWYWELVETAYRLSLTGFLVLGAYAGSNGQMVLGLGLAVFFTKVCEVFEPFLETVNQSAKVVALWEINLVFFLFILMKAEFLSTSVISVLALLLAVAIAVDFVLAIRRVVQQFLTKASSENLKELIRRDRSISNASSASERQRALTLSPPVFSPFNTLGPRKIESESEESNAG